ncbi:NPCBM/NEW2 domain-containing protein [Faecalimonas sp.]
MKRNTKRNIIMSILLVFTLLVQPMVSLAQSKDGNEKKNGTIVIDVLDFGADPTGVNDSAESIWNALKEAKKVSDGGKKSVTLNFPKGEYHIYKDRAQKREYHTSNTNSIENPVKTIGILIEEQKNLTIEGNGSLFMMHGNMMALAVAKSENIRLHNFSWDFAVPTVSEMTITNMGKEGIHEYTDFYIPNCFPYEIQGNTILWKSENSPYTNKPYWTEKGIHNAYSVVAYQPESEMTRAYYTNQGPFEAATKIEKIGNNQVRVHYVGKRPNMQKKGMVLELASSAHRETAGAFTWESKNVHTEKVNVHFMHGFGWLIQMSENVYYKDCNLMPRESSGHLTVSYADGIHASGASGEIVIENCNFANTHDDPINLHGTFTRVEKRIDAHTLELKYIHNQQGGFPQYHVGDKVQFFTRDLLSSTDGEKQYEVAEVISNPGEHGNDLRTMKVKFKEELPSNLSDKIGVQPKYVAENVTYAPKVTIRNCTFRNVPTRGILCTTRKEVVIENNVFHNMSMATIFLSNDSNDWYESGPIRDMKIKNNTFYVKDIGRTSWEYAPAIYIHPVTKGGQFPDASNPIHKNISIEGNTFYMDEDTVVKAESVENLTFKNNKVYRMNPDVKVGITLQNQTIQAGQSVQLKTDAQGNTNNKNVDNVFEFTKSKDIKIENNVYDDGLKLYAIAEDDATEKNISIQGDDIKIIRNKNQAPVEPVRNICYASTNPDVAIVNKNGQIKGIKAGKTTVFAYCQWNDTIVKSNEIEVTVAGEVTESDAIQIKEDDNKEVKVNEKINFTLKKGTGATWSVTDFVTNEETNIATISATGEFTAKANGVVWVNAVKGNAKDRKAVIIYGGEVQALNTDFAITREDKAKYKLTEKSIELTMQPGDLYTNTNTVKNLFLYNPKNVDKNNLRAVVKVDGLPIKEDNQWDTASFILYNDDDNYVTVGKKSHYNGIATVEEKNASAQEYHGKVEDNNLSSAYLGITKKADKITLSYKKENGEWQTAKEFTNASFGNNYKIGMACWESKARAKKVTFSDFHVGSADTDFAALLKETAISVQKGKTERPTVSDVKAKRENGKVKVEYTFADKQGAKEGETVYRWYWKENEEEKTIVTKEKELSVAGKTDIFCQVYPKDQYGITGKPSEKVKAEITPEDTDELQEISVNHGVVYKRGANKQQSVFVPKALQKIEVSYVSVNDGIGETRVYKNGVQVEGKRNNTDHLMLEVQDKDEIKIVRGKNTYILTVQLKGDSTIQVNKLSMPQLHFEQNKPIEERSFYTNGIGSATSSDVVVETEGKIGKVEVFEGEYRKPLKVSNERNRYIAKAKFRNGLNSFYIRVYAEDNTTYKQYILNVTYMPSSEINVSGITLNGKVIENFDGTKEDYFFALDKTEKHLKVKVDTTVSTVKISLNGEVKNGLEATFNELKSGENTLLIQCVAGDQLLKKNYRITVYKQFDQNAGIQEVLLGKKDITSDIQNEKNLSEQFVDADKVMLKVTTIDPDATVEVKQGREKAATRNRFEGELNVYDGLQNVDIIVTAADGKTKETYRIALRKGAYLSDLEWESATVGYGTQVNRDKNHLGSTIQLANEKGEPVEFKKGLGTHAESVIVYNIAGKGYKALEGFVGIDYCQYNANDGKVQFCIEVDGQNVFDSGEMTQKTPMKKFAVELPKNAKKVTLKALQGENNFNDHANWADAKFLGTFPEKTYSITAKPNHEQMGVVEIVPEKSIYQIGEEIKVIANANEGYTFIGWVEDNSVISMDKEYTFTADKNRNLIAQFEKVEEPDKPVTPDKPIIPEEPNKPQIPSKPAKPNAQKPSQNGIIEQSHNAVKTGDKSHSEMMVFGLGISAITLAYVLGRRRK